MRRGRMRPVPNGFRHMDVLTNEGRSWYQGVRFSGVHRTTPLVADRVVHVLECGGHAEPLVLAREQSRSRSPIAARPAPSTPHNLVTSVTWNLPGSGPVLGGWRLSAVTHHQSGSPYTIRYAGDPVGYGAGSALPATRAAASRARRADATPSAACSSTTPTSRWREQFQVGGDRIEFRADVFNMFNNQNLLAGGIHRPGRQPAVRSAHGRRQRPARPSVPVRGDVSILRIKRREDILVALVLQRGGFGHRARINTIEDRSRARADRARRHRRSKSIRPRRRSPPRTS